jgi:beta-lactamase class A
MYPMLTDTHWEAGIPSGVPPGITVVHKVGWIYATNNDAALVVNGPRGAYILVVTTDGRGGDAGWALISQISAIVWAVESAR